MLPPLYEGRRKLCQSICGMFSLPFLQWGEISREYNNYRRRKRKPVTMAANEFCEKRKLKESSDSTLVSPLVPDKKTIGDVSSSLNNLKTTSISATSDDNAIDIMEVN